MARPRTYENTFEYEGTAQELERYLQQQEPEQRFRLTRVADQHSIKGVKYPSLSVEERIKMMDALAEQNRDLPILPPEAFDREKLQEERL